MFKGKSAAIYKDEGVNEFVLDAGLRALKYRGVDIDCINADDIKNGALQGCDMLVMPGGADEPYHERLGDDGARLIREYVEGGGAYFGICAGAYYACDHFEFNKGRASEICRERPLKLFKGWAKGSLLELAPPYDNTLDSAAIAALATPCGEKESFASYYHGGPVFMGIDTDPDVQVLAVYPDLPANQNAAIIYKDVGKGRVILSSPHVEVCADDFQRRLRSETHPQEYLNILNDLERLATAREAFFQKMLGLLLN